MKLDFSKLGFWDISLTKLSVLCATLFIVSAWPLFAAWVQTTHWALFLILALGFAIKPLYSLFRK